MQAIGNYRRLDEMAEQGSNVGARDLLDPPTVPAIRCPFKKALGLLKRSWPIIPLREKLGNNILNTARALLLCRIAPLGNGTQDFNCRVSCVFQSEGRIISDCMFLVLPPYLYRTAQDFEPVPGWITR